MENKKLYIVNVSMEQEIYQRKIKFKTLLIDISYKSI